MLSTNLGRRLRTPVAVLVAAGALLTGASSTAHADSDPPPVGPQVIGGHAPTENYPAGAMVSLKYDAPLHDRVNWHTCGGYMPFQNIVVTNAHCVTDPPAELSNEARMRLARQFGMEALPTPIPTRDKQFWVRAGSPNKNEGGQTANVEVVWVDPDWDWATGGGPVDDIAVLKTDHSLDIQTIQIAPAKATSRTKVYQVGWGVVNPDNSGPLPTMIQEIQSTVASNRACRDAFITVREICINNVNGTDGICYGDSGGPAMTKVDGVFYVVGGTSRGASEWCGIVPAVYTSTPEHRTAIYDAARGVPAGSTGRVTGHRSIMNGDPVMGLPYEKPDGCVAINEAACVR